MDTTNSIGIGLIGTGFMGKCHALAYAAVRGVFGDVPTPRLEMLCDVPRERAAQMATQFGFARSTPDWRELVSDPGVDVVAITTPNRLHKEMAMAATDNGKHVYCEKPLGLTLEEAEQMTAAAGAAGVGTLVGYNYLRNPALIHARSLIRTGTIGRILQFRGVCDEDYMADPELPWSWRCRVVEAGLGTLGDLACHLVSVACWLVGPVASVCADTRVVHKTRPLPDGTGTGVVENEDLATALVHFDDGVTGSLASSRSTWGRKGHLAWEAHGDRGTLLFDHERMNELRLFQAKDEASVQGFKTILTGPAHPPYDRFCPAPGHGLGFNDQKVIEVAHLLRGLAGQETLFPSFADALHYERVIHAIDRSAWAQTWINIDTL